MWCTTCDAAEGNNVCSHCIRLLSAWTLVCVHIWCCFKSSFHARQVVALFGFFKAVEYCYIKDQE